VLPATSVTSYRKDEEAYVTPASSTLNIGKVSLTHSLYPGLVAGLTDIQTRLNKLISAYSGEDLSGQQKDKQADCDETRENSLSPEEYLGIQKARDLALHTTTRPITPPDQSSPPRPQPTCEGTPVEVLPSSTNEIDVIDTSLPGVEKDLPPASLAAILATDFYSANTSEKKEIRKRAKRENVVIAFEEEIRRIGTLTRTLA
jgi:hypothetical protein